MKTTASKVDPFGLYVNLSESSGIQYEITKGQKRMNGILELLGFEVGTTVTGLQQSEMACVHKDALQSEVNASVREAALYISGNEGIPSGFVPKVILIQYNNLLTLS